MSCAGFDFGNANCLVAIARRGGIDVCTNEVSNRTTPCLVAFSGESRSIGESAVSSVVQNFKNTVTEVKRLLGRAYDDPEVQRQLKRSFFEIVKEEDGRTGIRVQYGANGEKQIFSPEAIVAMILTNLGETASAEYGSTVKDCVISIPAYFTDAQRRAMKDAAKIAGFNTLRLFHEHAAAALSYGLYRTAELPDSDPYKVAIVDVGNSATTVSIVGFLKTKLTVYSVAFDSNLGGRDFDEVLFDHFASEFDKKYKLDIRSNPRATIRLRVACEKLKKVLSANPEAPLNVECIMNDVDVSGYLKRSEFEQMSEELIKRICLTCQKALEGANVQVQDIQSVEVVGGSSRIPSLQNALEQFFGRSVMKTLNAEETVGRGCALQGAIISPAFRVRPYAVEDVMPYPISIHKRCEDSEERIQLFTRFNPIPSLKQLTFTVPYAPVELTGYYENSEVAPIGGSGITKFVLEAPKKKDSEKDMARVRVRVKLTADGILALHSAYSLEEFEEQVQKNEEGKHSVSNERENPEKTNDKMDISDQANSNAEKGDPNVQSEQNGNVTVKVEGNSTENLQADHSAAMSDSNNTANETENKETTEKGKPDSQIKKVKTKQIDLKFDETLCFGGFSDSQVETARAAELEMRARDRYLRDRSDALNSLESYVYDMRNNLSEYGGPLKDFVLSEDRVRLLEELDSLENWIYSDEASSASKSVFTEKLASIKSRGDAIVQRKFEWETRPEAIAELQRVCDMYRSLASSTSAEFEHITEEDRKKVTDKTQETENWLAKQVPLLEKLQKHEDCPVTVAQIRQKSKAVEQFCHPIMYRPKPAPPKKSKEQSSSGNGDAQKDSSEKMQTETAENEKGVENGKGTENKDSGDAMETEPTQT
ncbi:molecular chaperone DnaK [Galdieria sulphuraria]|uniref:Molecular chaperone DnaK n=1 Tax=Galdieria sulphuraria TaxID=130081 RepID=M2WRP2_GALSU|nr:molecular chaperone DnaK [Galdieria sulphuraria]EME26490.1 molecular chaperone DnaK [Galdieria sulphuraria]|eukprot:XP_005703010.1 molecular chaperone DnaK [Galdieria sulphuraria]